MSTNRELAGNQRLPFLEAAIELYLAGDELGKARETLDNAQMRYFIVHLHRLLDPARTGT